jgi:2'-5' RNA ligase
MRKTHLTALAVVPPEGAWGPIQTIRARHDRQFRRWMPHVNLLYPFLVPERFDEALPRLAEACARAGPFLVTLARLDLFLHPSGKATLWLAPEPREALVGLQAALRASCPECDDLSRFPAGFTPHLSVGQAGSAQSARQLLAELQAAWQPLRFEVSSVAVLRRGKDAPFEIDHRIPLAAGS